MEMIQLLNYLSDERERISLLSALRSSMFALTDPEVFNLFYEKNPTLDQFLSSDNSHVRSVGRQIQSWRLLSGRLTLSELIRVIIADQNLTAIHSVHPDGMQRLANMEKLIDIARRFQAEGNGSLPEFVKYSLEMAEEEEVEGEALLVSEGENPICLMTIHGAKGLEFPMVIIPDLGRRLPFRTEVGKSIRLYSSRKGRPGDWNFEEGEVPVWPVEVPELNFTKIYSPLGYLLIRRNRLEEMAENRRLFYVGCTRTRNHLILIGRMQKRLLEKDRASLTTEDYRERATIMDLLDDIYQFSINFSQEKSDIFEGNGGMPTVIWREPESRKFRGVLYGEEKLSQNDFGIYDSKIKEFDLTGPIKAPPYYQFSFKSIRIFMQCPIRFYYSVILGLKMDVRNVSGLPVHGPSVQDVDFEDNNDWEYGSKEALFLGNVIHGYLERHRFGNILDENLFKRVYERLSQPDLNKAPLREKAFKQLEAAVNDERLIRIIGGEREYAEMPFLFTLSDGCEFRGIMDRLIKNREEGHWVIFDWKSNDLKDKDPHLVAEENGYNLQLACYRWAVEHILNEKVGELYIYFTDGGHLLKSHWGGDLEKIFNKMLQEVRDYENNRDRWVRDLREMKRDKSNCRFCEYRANLCGGGKE